MLLRRLQTLLNVRERAALLRLYFAGTHVQPNLQTQWNQSRNQNFCTVNPPVHVRTTQRRFASSKTRCAEITRSASSDDDNKSLITENSYAREILVQSKKAPKTIGLPLETIETVSDDDAEAILSRDWKLSSPDEISKAFTRLSCHASLNSISFSQEKHNAILQALCNNIQELDDEQLRRVFQCLLLWQNVVSNTCSDYIPLCKEMDKACTKRLSTWSVEEALLFCDYWYQLRLHKRVSYPWLMIRRWGNKPNKLNPINFLHLMFIVNVCRQRPLNMYEIEYRLDKIMQEFTANELGIIAMAFFKTETPFRDTKIVSRMQTIMIREWDEVGDICLSAVMKMTRYSMGLNELQILRAILDRVKSRVSTLSLQCLVHVAHAASFVQIYDADLIEMIIERFEKDIDSARLKDMSRICWSLSIFNYDSETRLFHKIVECLRDPKRETEIARFPTMIPTTLMHLSHAGVFPVDLIQKSLDPAFLRRVYDNNIYKVGWEFFALENNTKIEVPEYDGPFLPDNIRKFLAKKYVVASGDGKAKVGTAEKFTIEVAHMCKLALGSDTAIHIDQLLPHFMKPDIIVCLDEANNPVAPEPILTKIPVGTIKYAPKEASNLRWIAIVLATQNQIIRDTGRHIGLLTSKIRQLKKIGYTPIVVPHTEWYALNNLKDKQNCLTRILSLAPDRKVSKSRAV